MNITLQAQVWEYNRLVTGTQLNQLSYSPSVFDNHFGVEHFILGRTQEMTPIWKSFQNIPTIQNLGNK